MGLEDVPQREGKDSKRLTGRNSDPDPYPVFGPDPDSDLDLESDPDINLSQDPDLDPNLNSGPDLSLELFYTWTGTKAETLVQTQAQTRHNLD